MKELYNFMSNETKYEVVDETTNEVEPVASLEFGDEEVTATLEDGEKVEFSNPGQEGQLENDTHVMREVETHNHPDGTKPKFYQGKEVLSEGTHEVNGKEYKTIRLVDGSTYDLTDEEYALQVTE